MRLLKQEQETIINFNQQEHITYIYTCSKSWIRHMEKTLGLKPTVVHSYAREYECPKAWIKKPRKTRQMSAEQKQRLSERLNQRAVICGETPCTVGNNGGGSANS